MRLSDLRDWHKLSEAERERIKRVYGRSPDIEPSLHDTNEESLDKAAKHPYNSMLQERDGKNAEN